MKESVLCVKESVLGEIWPRRPACSEITSRLSVNDESIFFLVTLPFKETFIVRERPDVETDETVKQLVTYVVVRRRRYGILRYRRPAWSGEGRLTKRMSIGIGGHVGAPQPVDLMAMGHSPSAVYSYLRSEAIRELREELDLGPWTLIELVPQGLIYDASTPVGRVHLGLLFSAYLEDEGKLNIDPDSLEDAQFRGLGDICTLDRSAYEPWSRIVIKLLAAEARGISGSPSSSED